MYIVYDPFSTPYTHLAVIYHLYSGFVIYLENICVTLFDFSGYYLNPFAIVYPMIMILDNITILLENLFLQFVFFNSLHVFLDLFS